jgi:Flp pilus assembly secretin CpaC
MLEASRHLELAGMKNEAEKLREECVGEVSKLMRRLKAAEAELAQLRKSAPAAKTVHRDVPAASPCSYAPDSACFKPTCEQGKQVVVEVQMIEIDRNKLTNMGFDFAYIDDAGEPCSGSAVDAVFNAAGKPRVAGCDTTRFGVLDDVKGLMGFLEALKQEEAAKVLSQPTVTTMIGRAAAFQIGGEFPVPTPQNDGATTIEYKTFGTELNLLPLMTEDNKLRLEMRARVSELDMSREVQVAGQSVPGLKVRQIDTGVEMKPGQTWIVGGMATNRNEGGKQTPVELLMIIKPEIVEPTKCATACKAAPCAKCECNPCGNCKPASHEESSPVPMPSF